MFVGVQFLEFRVCSREYVVFPAERIGDCLNVGNYVVYHDVVVNVGFADLAVNYVFCKSCDSVNLFSFNAFYGLNYRAYGIDYAVKFEIERVRYEFNDLFVGVQFLEFCVCSREYVVFPAERIGDCLNVGNYVVYHDVVVNVGRADLAGNYVFCKSCDSVNLFRFNAFYGLNYRTYGIDYAVKFEIERICYEFNELFVGVQFFEFCICGREYVVL